MPDRLLHDIDQNLNVLRRISQRNHRIDRRAHKEQRAGAVGNARPHRIERTFFDRSRASPRIVKYYEQKFACKRWRKAFFETVRGTKSHSVKEKLSLVENPTLVVCGREDRIVDPIAVQEAVRDLPNYEFVMLPNCGHAPQLERPHLINKMVLDFLNAPHSAPAPRAMTGALAGTLASG